MRHPAPYIALASCLVLAGCPGETPVTPTASKAPVRRASPSPSAKPASPLPTIGGSTAPASAAPQASPSGQAPASPAPSASGGAASPVGPPPSGKKVDIAGQVFDEAGDGLAGATITARSLDQRAPFDGTATAGSDGKWTIAGVPEGANVEVVATKAGYTSRRRVAAYTTGFDATTDFGSSSGKAGAAAAFFLGKYPEIAALEPDAAALAAGRIGFELRFSAPIATADQARLLAAVRVWPANEAASPEGDADDEDDEDLADAPDTGAVLPEPQIETDADVDGYAVDYAAKDGIAFLAAGAVKPVGTWSGDGTTLTFAFAAPFTRGRKAVARYHVGLVRGTDATAIEDTGGDPLGTNRHGDPGGAAPLPGNLIRNVFREEVLSIADEDDNGTITAAERWTSTHDTVRTLELPADDAPPKPTAVKVVPDVAGNFRIELTFSEPMAAFNGKVDGRAHGSLDGDRDRDGFVDDANFLRNYTFVLGAAAGETAGVTMDGYEAGDDLEADPRTASAYGIAGDREKELAFSIAALAFSRRIEGASTGEIVVDVAEDDPRIVRLTIKGRANWLDAGVKELRARVQGVSDPSGQAITAAAANGATVTTAIP